jgi:hypothetical protein
VLQDTVTGGLETRLREVHTNPTSNTHIRHSGAARARQCVRASSDFHTLEYRPDTPGSEFVMAKQLCPRPLS